MANFPESQSPNIFESLNACTTSTELRRRYAVSKLLGVLLTCEMAARVSASNSDGKNQPDIIVNCVNPGFCQSNLGSDGPLLGRLLRRVLRAILACKTEVGSRTLVFAAAASDDTHGKYLSDCHIAQPSKFVQSEEGHKTQLQLWKEIMEKFEDIGPGISKLVS